MSASSPLAIAVHGHGPQALVLIHGWAMHGGVFAPLIDALRAQCTLYVVDLPGHGASAHSRLTLEPTALARAIVEATPAAPWVGWSLGGQLALHGAIHYPNHVTALGMLAASPCFVRREDWPHGVKAGTFSHFANALNDDREAALARFCGLVVMGDRDARAKLRLLRELTRATDGPQPHALAKGLELLETTDLRAQIDALTVPSVWVGGRHDRLVPWQAMAASAEACGGQFTCIDSTGHAPFLGQAEAMAAALHPLFDPETA
ncbi:pimeloyl-ACP methyl ester esterase BioH [Oleiagrimonas sp. C23AA]|uniref:pimeloyl-ACP methyl ester esterase BioH n=1 Tax=Oleiagrimonas sp. C23AA TaxID=2719047 RepID=UPI00141F86F3|nr:pimeloyl-ACP methyl ester esterase BioH [Oleiagrimonas sp. C23AA]NII12237.1 pimeloyl-ACP methyl ester esterase BioH [Oleiagrimonas sp. C23AA]